MREACKNLICRKKYLENRTKNSTKEAATIVKIDEMVMKDTVKRAANGFDNLNISSDKRHSNTGESIPSTSHVGMPCNGGDHKKTFTHLHL